MITSRNVKYRGHAGESVAPTLPRKRRGVARINLTDRFIDSDKRTPTQGRADYLDAIVPGLTLRVTSKGHRSFVIVARYPINPKNPTRRAPGDYGEITLEEARERARGCRLNRHPSFATNSKKAGDDPASMQSLGGLGAAVVARVAAAKAVGGVVIRA
jgi:Arm DNA-binding domain